MNELSQYAQEQLRLAKRGFGPVPSDRERVHGSLMAALALGAAASTHTGAAAAGTPQVTSGALLTAQQGLVGKAMLVVALAGGAAGTVGYQLGYSKASQQIAAQPAAVRQPTTPLAADEITAPSPLPVVAAPIVAPAIPPAIPDSPEQKLGTRAASNGLAQPASADPAPAGTSPEAEEILQLERVQRALRDGYPALALAILGELDQKVPRGRLHEERSAARVIARCSMGEPSPDLSESFATRYPGSMYLERVAAACTPEKGKSLGTATEKAGGGQD